MNAAIPPLASYLNRSNSPATARSRSVNGLKLAIPAWCDADELRRQLCALLAAQFRNQPETTQTALDELRRRVEAQCIAFAIAKFGETDKARRFGVKLGWAAWSALDVPQMTQARAAFAILQARERALDQLKTAHGLLAAQMAKAQLSAELRAAVAVELAKAATIAENDPILELLRRFFAIRDGYWRRFFDQHESTAQKEAAELSDHAKTAGGYSACPRKAGLLAP